MRRTALARVVAAVAALVIVGVLAPSALAAKKSKTRDVLVVSNNWAGTADLVDPKRYKRLKRLNVIPDAERRIAEIKMDPTATAFFQLIRDLVGEGHHQYVDDGFMSPDGKVVYFSRPSFADVVAIRVRNNKIKWRTPVDGYRSDHMAITEDGRRLLVSASTANVVHEIDTRTGKIAGSFPSGDAPHENNYSRDEKLIYHASIGTVYTDTDDPSEDATKGDRFFQVVDADTLEVVRRIDMGAKLAEAGYPNMSSAVRPMAVTPSERYVYFQVSFFFGIVKYDLKKDRVDAVLDLPKGDARGMPRTEFVLDSAHHGLAMNPRGSKLCVAGTMSGYAAIVTRRPFEMQRKVKVGKTPYWSESSENGRHCFVSVAGEDKVVVISYRTGRKVAEISTGNHPQRMRTGVVRKAHLR